MHIFFGGLCFLILLSMVLKIPVNRNGPKKVSRFLAKHHIQLFALMMVAMLIHAFLAGFDGIPALTGWICFAMALAIAAIYYLMRHYCIEWKGTHAALAVVLMVATVVHIIIA